MPIQTVGIYPQTVAAYEQELTESGCDRCSATAKVLIKHPSGRLTLCGHHWHQHEAELTKAGWTVLANAFDPLTP